MTNAQLRRVLAAILVPIYAFFVVSAVFFPLPGPYATPLRQGIQLEPFQWVDDVRRGLGYSGLSLTQVLSAPAFEGAALNVLLFVPLGIFARMLFRRGFIGTMLIGFACSLFIELTQLTANWGTAPLQYRIFDVDDLINNTAGAMIGWIAAAVLLAVVSAARNEKALSYRAAAPTAMIHPVRPVVPAGPPYARPPAAWLAGPPMPPLRQRP